LAGQPDVLALADTLGNAHIEGAFPHHRPSVGPQLGVLEGDGAAGAVVGVLQVDENPGVGVLPPGVIALAAAGTETATEQVLEEVAEVAGIGTGKTTAVE